MNENNIRVGLPSLRSNKRDQAGQALSGVDRVYGQSFERSRKLDGLDGCCMRHAISRTGVPGDDLDMVLVEIGTDQIGCGSCVGDNVGTHALGFGIDVDTDDPRLRHRNRCPDNKTGLGSRTTGAMYDRGGANAESPRLLRDLHNCRCVGNRAEWIGNTVWHDVRPTTFCPEPVSQFLNRSVAISRPRYVMEMRAEQPVEERISRSFVLRAGGATRPW